MPQPVPPVPGIPAGYSPLPADFDLWVTGSFSFLSQPANFRAQLAAAHTLTGGIYNLIPFDTVLEDPYGGWSAVTTGSQPAWSWLCPAGCAGWYEVTMSGFTGNQGSSTAQVSPVLALNGSAWAYGSDDWAVNGGDSGSSGAVQVPLLPGDYVQVWVFVTVTASTPVTAGQLTAIELAWVSS